MCMLRPRCGLGMLHGTTEICMGVLDWGMENAQLGCTLYLPINLKPWGIKKHPIPYMM